MRTKRQTLLRVGLGGGLVLAGVGTVALWLQAGPDPSHVVPTPASQQAEALAQPGAPEDLAALKAEIAHLNTGKEGLERLSGEMKSELSALRARLTQVDWNQAAFGQELTKLAGAEPAGGSEGDPLAFTPEEEHERADAQAQAQIEVLEGTVRAEQPDPQWAPTAQAALYQAFQGEATKGLQLVDAKCGATLCRVDLASNGAGSPEASFRNLVHLAPWPGQGFFRIDGESGEAVVYLAREGHALPQAGK